MVDGIKTFYLARQQHITGQSIHVYIHTYTCTHPKRLNGYRRTERSARRQVRGIPKFKE